MKIYFETNVEADLETVIEGFNESLFLALKPWWMPAKLRQFGMKFGDKVILDFPLNQQWVSELTEVDNASPAYFQFIDEGIALPFPLKNWKHIHRLESIEAQSQEGTKIIDNIEYQASFKLLEYLMYPLLWYSFKIRAPIYCSMFKVKH